MSELKFCPRLRTVARGGRALSFGSRSWSILHVLLVDGCIETANIVHEFPTDGSFYQTIHRLRARLRQIGCDIEHADGMYSLTVHPES